MNKPSGKYSLVLACLTLALITFLAFEQVRYNKFINYDDDEYITKNTHVLEGLNLENIKWAFTTDSVANWHPLTWLSHMLDCQLFGVNAGRHHIINLLLHIANTILLLILLKQATGKLWQSAFVAAAFALHPAHVESVAWASERKDVLSTFFGLLAIASYVKYVKNSVVRIQNGKQTNRLKSAANHPLLATGYWLLTTVFYILSLLSKPMLVTMPFILLLLDYWPLGRIEKLRPFRKIFRLLIEKIPFFVLSAAACIVTFLVQRKSGAVSEIFLNIRIANVAISYVQYIWKLIWPSKLAIFYPLTLTKIPIWPAITAGLLLFMITAWIISQAKYKFLTVGWFWYLGTLVPVIGLVQVGGQAMADRYTYIPSIGLFIITAWGINELIRLAEAGLTAGLRIRKILLGVLAAAVILAMAVRTNVQVQYWRDSMTVCNHALTVTRNNNLAHNNLGVALNELGRYKEAIEQYKQALRIRPDDAIVIYNLGNTYGLLGRYSEAAVQYVQAVRIKPDYPEAHNNLGNSFDALGYYTEAAEEYKQAVKIKPDYADAYNNLGGAYFKLGRYADAVEECKTAIKIKPDFAHSYYNLGLALLKKGDRTAALEAYNTLKRLNPEKAAELYKLIGKDGTAEK